jgi:hypothetical protein
MQNQRLIAFLVTIWWLFYFARWRLFDTYDQPLAAQAVKIDIVFLILQRNCCNLPKHQVLLQMINLLPLAVYNLAFLNRCISPKIIGAHYYMLLGLIK